MIVHAASATRSKDNWSWTHMAACVCSFISYLNCGLWQAKQTTYETVCTVAEVATGKGHVRTVERVWWELGLVWIPYTIDLEIFVLLNFPIVCKTFLCGTHIFLMVNWFYACSLVQLRLWILRSMKSETVRRACCCIHGYHATVGMYERGPGHAVVMWCGSWETVKIFLQWDFQIYSIAYATVDWKQEIFLLWSNVLLLPACIQLSSLHVHSTSTATTSSTTGSGGLSTDQKIEIGVPIGCTDSYSSDFSSYWCIEVLEETFE